MKRILIDTLSADRGFETIARGAFRSLEILPEDYRLVLLGPKEKISSLPGFDADRIELIDVSAAFPQNGDPRALARGGDETSLVQMLLSLRNEDCVAGITAGSTGGLLVGSLFRLPSVKNVKFPALASCLYDKTGKFFCLVDCGANVDIEPRQTVKFAKMGSALMKSIYQIDSPRVGLLNVGSEKGEGNAFCKEAYPLLEESGLPFVGNIDGGEFYQDKADVIVADGFAGNVVLKTTEAAALVIEDWARESGDLALAERIHKNFAYNDEGAAIILGSKKVLLKAHGNASEDTIVSSVRMAVRLSEGNLPEILEEAMAQE